MWLFHAKCLKKRQIKLSFRRVHVLSGRCSRAKLSEPSNPAAMPYARKLFRVTADVVTGVPCSSRCSMT